MTTLTSTAAATQAGVTVATIRSWCRRGTVTATKAAGRWVINASSLARRITIGTWRNSVAPSPTPTPGTMAARGRDYVAAWPTGITRKHNLGCEHIAEALTRAGITSHDEGQALRPALLKKEYINQIADLTPATAAAVIAELRAISTEIAEAAKTHCHYCGLKLPVSGNCPSCGDGEY